MRNENENENDLSDEYWEAYDSHESMLDSSSFEAYDYQAEYFNSENEE